MEMTEREQVFISSGGTKLLLIMDPGKLRSESSLLRQCGVDLVSMALSANLIRRASRPDDNETYFALTNRGIDLRRM